VKISARMRRGKCFILSAAAAALAVLLIAGCSSKGSGPGVQQIMQQYSWLVPLGWSVIQYLLQEYGSNLAALLAAAASLLAG
jgi:hypothetical protein